MVAGLAAFALDPNSAYFDPDALDLLQEEQQGEIQGIGALVSPEDQTIPGDNKQCGVISETCEMLIISTIEGAPADDVAALLADTIGDLCRGQVLELQHLYDVARTEEDYQSTIEGKIPLSLVVLDEMQQYIGDDNEKALAVQNIAEGCGRSGDAELCRFMLISMGSASELEYHLLLANDLGYLDPQQYRDLSRKTREVKRMLSTFITKLRRNPS